MGGGVAGHVMSVGLMVRHQCQDSVCLLFNIFSQTVLGGPDV